MFCLSGAFQLSKSKCAIEIPNLKEALETSIGSVLIIRVECTVGPVLSSCIELRLLFKNVTFGKGK